MPFGIANGNRVRLRKRDGRSISYCFDALDRQTRKFLNTASPNCAASSGAADDVYTAYDAAGRPTAVLFQSATGQGIAYGYDSAGRLTSETSFGRAMAYGWDKAGNRTRVTWPDTSFYVDYEYDPLNRVSKIKEKGGSSGAPLLAVFGYDDLGRRTGLTRGNGTTTGWGWDTADRLTSLAHDPASTAYDQTWGYSYNPASQVIGRTAGNALYDWTNRPAGTVTKSYDGLNRDAGLASLGDGYDLNGNVTHDARQLYAYDIENRLVSVADAGTSASVLSLAYDPLGRLRSQTASGVTTQFLYDGDRLAAEYNSGGTLTARYVHGAGVDEPLVWYGDNGVGLRRHLYSDAQGSVVARSGDAAGSVAKVYAYGPYGEPQAWDDSRFAYTGQIELREAGLYYYKARVYDPSVGRFLQTDSVGYEADLDLYTYVGGDPLNRTDPSGTAPAPATNAPPAPTTMIEALNSGPPANLPGGPYAPAGNGQQPGTYHGPARPEGGPRSTARFVPSESEGGPKGSTGYWKTQQPGQKGWDRFTIRGEPQTAAEAHPGAPGQSIAETAKSIDSKLAPAKIIGSSLRGGPVVAGVVTFLVVVFWGTPAN